MTRPTRDEQLLSFDSDLERSRLIDADAVQAAREDALSADELERLSEMFMVIADPTRLRILAALTDRAMYVSDLVHVVGRSQSAVSHQMRVFRQAGLVKMEREGRRIRYSLDDSHVELLFRTARAHVNHQDIASTQSVTTGDVSNES